MYTCWETRKNARPGNFGSRIDYVLCSSGIKDWFIDSNIQEGLLGSDHCPVYATIGDTVHLNGTKVRIEDIMNPPGMFKDGERQREWSPKDLLPTSAKLIPEFDRRQSIRDMFFKKAAPSVKSTSKSTPTASQDTLTATNTSVVEENGDEAPKAGVVSASQSSSLTTALVTSTNTTLGNDTSMSPTQNPPPKRQAESTAGPTRPQKKGKVALNRENSAKSTPGFSQSSLRGFFKPTTPTPDANPTPDAATPPNKPSAEPNSKQDPQPRKPAGETATENDVQATVEESPKPESSSTEKVFDPIQAKESWSKLLGKRVVPRCEHGEDCQMLVTKKAGINCGMYYPPLLNSNTLVSRVGTGPSFLKCLSLCQSPSSTHFSVLSECPSVLTCCMLALYRS
jgi:AP endonuclease-2